MSAPIRDQVVLVTGSSRGVGLAIAQAFRKEGAKIVINYHNTASRQTAEAAADDLDAVALQADVTDAAAMKQLFASAEHIYRQPISVVVNNALADFQFNPDNRAKIDSITWEEFDNQLQGSVKGALNTTQAALPGFERLGYGRIVNISSNLLHDPKVPYHDYVASKGALLGLTRTAAHDLGPKAITVNLVSGGLLQTTDASKHTSDEVFEMIKAVTPLRKVTTPKDIAGAVLFFASPWASAITGQNLIVDGGACMN